ncbi:hypothetical protein KO561_01245 [Radiobacillus kanasensis]|uniref:hypothetical protein n=1 Tax=Radiobacillus kanasensis TaxID=2844358 RepID=UPI001E2D828B|nr:hypothetical protein [Radiobacillus kanasensis]UFT99631.1 hypothetical protein KO561_01245 [Radiobacillus kanasensis]
MTKTKWLLILLGVIDLILIIMHVTDYFILLLKPTGYLIPLGINIIVLSVIGFRSSRYHKVWSITGLILGILLFMAHGFMVLLADNSYAKIDSPNSHHSLVIEYRHATLGETTYFYNFYKTTFGFIGKHLNDQSITLMIGGTEHPTGLGAEGVLGLGNEEWISGNTVRFPTSQGMKDVHLNLSQSVSATDIEAFIDKVKNKDNGHTITINGNRLKIRYDKEYDQSWIDVSNNNGEGAIPTQQCSRLVPNEERGYYMLEECTHQWEYPLYPLTN